MKNDSARFRSSFESILLVFKMIEKSMPKKTYECERVSSPRLLFLTYLGPWHTINCIFLFQTWCFLTKYTSSPQVLGQKFASLRYFPTKPPPPLMARYFVLDTLSSKIWWASSTYQCRSLDAEIRTKKTSTKMGGLAFLIPKASMGLVYLPANLPYKLSKCR